MQARVCTREDETKLVIMSFFTDFSSFYCSLSV